MSELISDKHLKTIEKLLKDWNDASRAALEHNTPQNNRAADILAGVLAGYVRPLFNTLQEIERRSGVGYIFEGLDELNEDTHEENEALLINTMDTINEIARGKFEDDYESDDGLLTCSVCADRYTTNENGVCDHCKQQAWLDTHA